MQIYSQIYKDFMRVTECCEHCCDVLNALNGVISTNVFFIGLKFFSFPSFISWCIVCMYISFFA